MSEIHDGGALLAAVYRYAGFSKPTPNDCERPVYVASLRGDYDGGRLWAVTIEGTPVRAMLFIEGEAVYVVRPIMRRNPGPLGPLAKGAARELYELALAMVRGQGIPDSLQLYR